MWVALLVAWIVWQPWFCWPSLYPDTSHRLTLLFLSALVGVVACSTARKVSPLPRLWTLFGASLAWTMVWRAWPVICRGDYFRFFIETAAWADGTLVLLSVWWAAWGWRQAGRERLRVVAPMMMVLLVVNTVYVVGQAHGKPWWVGSYMEGHLTGVMGLDRLLAAYAVACLPVCLSISPLLACWPVVLIVACAKSAAYVGLAAALCAWDARWVAGVVPAAAVLALRCSSGVMSVKISQRALTWWHGFQATCQHPFVGWGFSPMALSSIQQQYGYMLPSPHSDLLALAIASGWVVCAIALAWVAQLVLASPRSQQERMLRASLLGLFSTSVVQSVISHPRLGSLALLLSVWWIVERSTTKESHA